MTEKEHKAESNTGYPDSFISQAEQAIDEVEMFNNQDH